MSFHQFAELLKQNFAGKGFHIKHLENDSATSLAVEEVNSSQSSPRDPILPDMITSPMEQMLGDVLEPFSFDFDVNNNDQTIC